MAIADLLQTISNKKLGLPSDVKTSELLKQNIRMLIIQYDQVTNNENTEIQLILKDIDRLNLKPISASDLTAQLFTLQRAIYNTPYREYYFSAAFLSKRTPDDKESCIIMQARILISASYLSSLKGYIGIIKKAFQHFRSMFDKKENIISFLPDFSLPLKKLICELDVLRLKNPKFELRIMPIKNC